MENYKSILFFIGIAFTTAFCCQSSAYTPEEGKVTATLGPYINRTNFAGSNTGAEASYLGGISLVAAGDISDHGALEIAMIYTPQIFFRDVGGKYLAEKVQTIHITMGYRWWLSPYFSTSLAFFSAYPMGNIEVVHNDFNSITDADTSARDATDYGFDWAIQGEIWSNERYAVVGEGRYSLSVTPKKSEHSDQYGVMMGIRYTIQEEKKVEKPPQH